jgi:1-phosphofructokinase family hexose kinase
VILSIAPSPAVDRTARVDRFTEGVVLRPTELVVLPGGKAITAARVARTLGAIVVTTGYAGGHTGRWIVEALAGEGLSPRFVESSAEARTTYVLLDGRSRSLLVYEPAPPVTDAEVAQLHELLRTELLPATDFVVIAGSFPAGSGPGAAAALVELVHAAGRECLVDTSGPALLAVAPVRPDVVKISLEEARGVGLVAPDDPAPAQTATERLSDLGVGLAVVTDGPRGAIAFDGSDHWRITVPTVAATSTVGSGNAFSAGLAVALAAGRPIPDALACGAASGTANAQSIGGGRFPLATFEAVLGAVRVERIRRGRTGSRARPQGHM